MYINSNEHKPLKRDLRHNYPDVVHYRLAKTLED
jgi:hypothetical protein